MSTEPQDARQRRRRMTRRQRAEYEEQQRRRRRLIGGGAVVAFVAIIALVLGTQFIGGDDGDDDFPEIQVSEAGYDDIPQDRNTLGDPDAPIHLIEWSDYQ